MVGIAVLTPHYGPTRLLHPHQDFPMLAIEQNERSPRAYAARYRTAIRCDVAQAIFVASDPVLFSS